MKLKTTIAAASMLLLTLSTQAHAMDTTYYYDGLQPKNYKASYKLAKAISNDKTIMKLQGNSDSSRYKAVGYIKNGYGWAGKGTDTMGTGFVIDDYTVLTNAHVIDTDKGKATAAKYVRFMMNRDGDKIPYDFAVKDIVKIPSADLAVLHTKERLSKYVKPLKLATDQQILNLRKGTSLYSVGYPYHGTDDYTVRYWNQAVYLGLSANMTEMMMKDQFRAGASGSLLVDANFNVYGVRTYSHKLYNVDDTKYGKVELAGAESLYGYSGWQVLQNSY